MWILLSECAIFITLLLVQSVNGYVVRIHTQGVASLALGYALIGLCYALLASSQQFKHA